MSQQIGGNATREGAIEALKEILAGNIGTGAKVHLYKATFTPSLLSVEADLAAAEADFNTYAPITLTWSAVGLDSAGQAFAISNSAFFQNVSGANPNLIGGAWMHSDIGMGGGAAKSVLFFPFANPVAMNAPLTTLTVAILLTMPDFTSLAILES